jgi:hypothetical protein
MIRYIGLLLCVIGQLTHTPIALAWEFPVKSGRCPTFYHGVTWQDYISGKETLPGNYMSTFGVEFKMAKAVGDPEAIGHLATNMCYLVAYVTNTKGYVNQKGYYTSRASPNAKGPDDMKGLEGDPQKFQINVYGVLLHFDNHGIIFDKRGHPVGILSCYNSDQCQNY